MDTEPLIAVRKYGWLDLQLHFLTRLQLLSMQASLGLTYGYSS
jgi:hypothetical protein